MERMDAMTMKMDAQCKEMKSRTECNHCRAKFDRLADRQSARPSGSLPSNTQPNPRDDEEEESTPQPQTPKPTKEAPTLKPYKPRISYPQRLRKEKMEAQYRKFLDMFHVVRINVPLVDVLAGMSNYRKFLKELISNKHKLEQISSAFLRDESLAIIQNKLDKSLPLELDTSDKFILVYQKG
ncbi:hypothetical protein Tco_0700895 [Tanacetum coccineum]